MLSKYLHYHYRAQDRSNWRATTNRLLRAEMMMVMITTKALSGYSLMPSVFSNKAVR